MREECHLPTLWALYQQALPYLEPAHLPNFGAEAPDREVNRSICKLRTAQLATWLSRHTRCTSLHEAKAVEYIWIGVLGFVVHDLPCGDASYLTHSYLGTTTGELIRPERFATDSHCEC